MSRRGKALISIAAARVLVLGAVGLRVLPLFTGPAGGSGVDDAFHICPFGIVTER